MTEQIKAKEITWICGYPFPVNLLINGYLRMPDNVGKASSSMSPVGQQSVSHEKGYTGGDPRGGRPNKGK